MLCSHVINVKDTKDFAKDQDPVHGVLKGENRKLKAGMVWDTPHIKTPLTKLRT